MKNFQLSNIRFIERIVVGNNNPSKIKTEEEISEEMEKVNDLIKKGTIIGIEKNFGIYQHGEHQVVLQYFCYHIGFERNNYK